MFKRTNGSQGNARVSFVSLDVYIHHSPSMNSADIHVKYRTKQCMPEGWLFHRGQLHGNNTLISINIF